MSDKAGDTHAAGRGVSNDTNAVNSGQQSVPRMTKVDIRAEAVHCYLQALYAAHNTDTLLAKRWADLGFTASRLADDITTAEAVTEELAELKKKQEATA